MSNALLGKLKIFERIRQINAIMIFVLFLIFKSVTIGK